MAAFGHPLSFATVRYGSVTAGGDWHTSAKSSQSQPTKLRAAPSSARLRSLQEVGLVESEGRRTNWPTTVVGE